MKSGADVNGVLVVDKPPGPTSHDVVARVRRLLGTRRVGHAGTLDPAASGVLVVLIGEATKLSPYLTAHDKTYAATVAFGEATSTWDAEGDITARAPMPDAIARELAAISASNVGDVCERSSPLLHAALTAERQRAMQVPPAFSAIKQQGRAVHERARRGEAVHLEPRAVEVLALDLVQASESALSVVLRVTKGYYVRSFAHDLGARLGVPAHLAALRRVASGPFTLDQACTGWEDASSARAHLQPIAAAASRAMPVGILAHAGVSRAQHGQPLQANDFEAPPVGSPAAWLDSEGDLVAVGTQTPGGAFLALRGFAHPTSSEETCRPRADRR